MDVTEMNTRRSAVARARRHALLEDLDWMRDTGETPERALARLNDLGYPYRSVDSLVRVLGRMRFDDDHADAYRRVHLWLVPARFVAVIPEQRGPRVRARDLVAV